MAITIENLMEQAQVYASAWSLVGGVFDKGGALEHAEQEKARLEDMFEQFQDEVDANAAPGNLKEIAEGLIQWHQNKLSDFDTILNAPRDTEIRISNGDDPLILSGETLKGARIGLMIAREWIEKFPLSITPSEPNDEEE